MVDTDLICIFPEVLYRTDNIDDDLLKKPLQENLMFFKVFSEYIEAYSFDDAGNSKIRENIKEHDRGSPHLKLSLFQQFRE